MLNFIKLCYHICLEFSGIAEKPQSEYFSYLCSRKTTTSRYNIHAMKPSDNTTHTPQRIGDIMREMQIIRPDGTIDLDKCFKNNNAL